jgi:hypothetical protein
LWDWLDLLIIPAVLSIGAWWLNAKERETDRIATAEREKIDRELTEIRREIDSEIPLERQRQTTLEAYYDRMTALLLKEELLKSAEDDPVRRIARAQTLATLSSLDDKRKGQVIRFLYEADLINRNAVIVRLEEADLIGVDLSEVGLRGANLEGTSLYHANLRGTDLREADLSRTNLVGANLRGAKLDGAKLGGANLYMTEYNANTRWPEDFDPKAVRVFLVEED